MNRNFGWNALYYKISILQGGPAMKMYDLINKKKHGESLTEEEISWLVSKYMSEEIADYQMSAFLMAVCLKGMNLKETAALTMAMARSGEILDLSAIKGKKADKHSTGGVGDKTTLVICPMTAALGVPVVKMSGRGLGHTGGTIDKLESIPGFRTSMSKEDLIAQVNRCGMAIVGQTAQLAPADKKLYALRDVTATVDNSSLIASSIMSKKIAAGADVVVLDVKTGSGAFMQTLAEASELAQMMVQIGEAAGVRTYAVISDMNQPLGTAVGNSLEVAEAVYTLMGQGPADLLEASLTLASYMLIGVGRAKNEEEARELLMGTIRDGSALEKFARVVREQGGDDSYIYHPERLPEAALVYELPAWEEGYVASIRTDEVGMAVQVLGGGRETKESRIDLSVGLKLYKKPGDSVTPGEKVAVLYANEEEKLKEAVRRLKGAYTFSSSPSEEKSRIYGVITKDGVNYRG